MAANPNSQTTQRRRALAYIRISSQRQINGESPQTQETYIQQYAANNNIEIVDTFYDEAKSGKNTDRQELQNMLRYAREHKNEIDLVIVYKMNRASRDMDSYVIGFRLQLKSLGIQIRSATEPGIDDTPTGQLLEYISIAIGQLDNDTKRGFTMDNMTALALQGYWQHPPIVGYETHKIANDIGKLRPTLKPSKMAPLVKQVLERFSQGDITKAELTRYAANINLRSRYGKKLSEDRINALLKHPVYAGYIVDNFTKGELVEGKHEALISLETFELNQALLNNKRKRTGEVHLKLNPDYPLKGSVLCLHCKKPLYASAPQTGNGGKSPRYHCSRSTCKGLFKSVGAAQIHEDFEKILKKLKPDEVVLTLYKEVLLTEASNQLATLNNKIRKIRSELDRVADNRLSAIKKFNADQLTADEKTELVAALDEEKMTYVDELRRLESQQAIREADIEATINVMQDVSRQWAISSVGARQRFQRILFPEGVVYDSTNRRFGTTAISSLYRYVPNKKDLPEPEKSFLVAVTGFEPARDCSQSLGKTPRIPLPPHGLPAPCCH